MRKNVRASSALAPDFITMEGKPYGIRIEVKGSLACKPEVNSSYMMVLGEDIYSPFRNVRTAKMDLNL